jgi:hypothetical protein
VNKNSQITINDIEVQIVRKKIKNLHLRVYAPDGDVRVTAPLHVDDRDVRLSVLGKIDWIRQQQIRMARQPVIAPQNMLSGECHYYLGKEYRLEVIEQHGRHRVELNGDNKIVFYVRAATSATARRRILTEWYRQQLKALIPALIQKWEPILGVRVHDWGVKKMRTRWGTCNITDGRIWLNLELVKRSEACLEYVLVHEMVHLLERYHNARFKAYMDEFIPQWRSYKDTLNRLPLSS